MAEIKVEVGQALSKALAFSQGSPCDFNSVCKSLYVRSRLKPIPAMAFTASRLEHPVNFLPINSDSSVSKWHTPQDLYIVICSEKEESEVDGFKNNIEEKLLYSILNQSKQLDNFILINSNESIQNLRFDLKDLRSRINSFLYIGIELPTDDLLKVIISKSLSDKQISINPKISDFIINNVERSYEKMFKFLKEVDELSLSTGKSININLIKKVLNQWINIEHIIAPN